MLGPPVGAHGERLQPPDPGPGPYQLPDGYYRCPCGRVHGRWDCADLLELTERPR